MKRIYQLFLLLFFVFAYTNIHAQVTIGLDLPPADAGLLQLMDQQPDANNVTATRGGLILPRVELENISTLQPFKQPGSEGYDEQKVLNTGLMVYNLNTVGTTLSPGIYQWDGESWNRLDASQTADFTINCDQISIRGEYYQGVSLTTMHSMVISVTVTVAGGYSIIAESDNGYSFQGSGVFTSTGNYFITLLGIGTPQQQGTDNLVIKNNGVEVNGTGGSPCSPTITITPPTVTYTIDCSGIQLYGTYSSSIVMDENNYGLLPIVSVYPGRAEFITNENNGVYFRVSQDINNTTTELRLQAYGTPQRAGAYNYTFTTNGGSRENCSFNVRFESSLGSFEDPAQNCAAILAEDITADDGEYWVKMDGAATPIKTFCDMTNGGWTLLWSYSERTHYETYPPANTFNVTGYGSFFNLNTNNPQNPITANNGDTIDFRNYRLPLSAMQQIKSANPGTYRVWIAYNPKNMNDSWAKLNHLTNILAGAATGDYITGSVASFLLYDATGKLFGKDLIVRRGASSGNTATYDGTTVGNVYLYATNPDYGIHFDAGYRLNGGSKTSVLPRADGTTYNFTYNSTDFNDLFGSFREPEIDQFWGKCNTSTDDYASYVGRCPLNGFVPHSFNNGEGRYLLWWVK